MRRDQIMAAIAAARVAGHAVSAALAEATMLGEDDEITHQAWQALEKASSA